MNTGTKKDHGKAPMNLLPFYALEEVALVLGEGAKKYGADNWRGGMNWSRLIAAAERHIGLLKERADIGDLDPETLTLHAANACCDLLFLVQYQLTGLGVDDRAAKLQTYQRDSLDALRAALRSERAAREAEAERIAEEAESLAASAALAEAAEPITQPLPPARLAPYTSRVPGARAAAGRRKAKAKAKAKAKPKPKPKPKAVSAKAGKGRARK